MIRFRQEHRGRRHDAIDALAIPVYPSDDKLVAIPTNKGDGVLAGGYVPAGWSHPEGWSLILIAYGAFAGHVDDEGRPICEADPAITEDLIVATDRLDYLDKLPDNAAAECVQIHLEEKTALFDDVRAAKRGQPQ